MALAFAVIGVRAETTGIGLSLPNITMPEAQQGLARLAALTAEALSQIEDHALGLCNAKYDEFVPGHLLRRLWGRTNAEAIFSIPSLARRMQTKGRKRE